MSADLWINNLHNNSEENSKPCLSKEVVEDEAAKSPRRREVQGTHSQGSSQEGAGREKPQTGGKTKELHQPIGKNIIYFKLYIYIAMYLSEKNPPAKTPNDPPKTDAQNVHMPISKSW